MQSCSTWKAFRVPPFTTAATLPCRVCTVSGKELVRGSALIMHGKESLSRLYLGCNVGGWMQKEEAYKVGTSNLIFMQDPPY
ncbi:hypothetical protein VNO78_05492 [Psophocarpus tetragonolobus]|uniref:Uncharacterized protein n=1 Tax=Psophocarpus tetragonolobus TaxID=3891 RepID=A0AAN9STV6_PSOTE